tara:strand:- start:13 stop:1248 length:1236 start_codon:yes stop_codon:yes gene_type:complete
MSIVGNQVICCPRCNSSKVKKKGFRHNRGDKIQRWKCNSCDYSFSDPLYLDKDVIIENVQLSKRAQRFQDKNRISNKSFREHARLDNALCEYNKHLIKLLDGNKIKCISKKTPYSYKNKAVGIIQISDTHFNELVDLPNNKYDFKVASKRLKTFITRAKTYLNAMGIKKVFVGMTGDLMNSDRRLDELLSMASNRAQATFLSVEILKQVLEDLQKDYKVSVGCITGNESRAKDEVGWSDIVASDNYDFTIFNILKYIFKETDVDFIESKDASELVVNIAGMNVLLLHGHGSIKAKHETSITQIKGRYSSHDIKIDYVLSGHIHSARIGDTYGRSSSLVGANAYSEKALNLEGRASQNIYIVHNNKTVDGIKIDLQYYDEKGYDITEELESYNAKSQDKLKSGKVVLKIINV